ncbi:universal stress protein [Kitasatospora viridis]|uniref:Nucleotide-binding universal stress UspA family protein n=1 Tax=Kitasatospora viridis TaxID=281105 RepID=A0A561TVT9_9ACTN|nr:universal stress protein [Kitasatospora viridis]TWF91225.1 nucleotide-binding universal stress UspA family protein [Kitasatospora viridis]
MAETSRVVVGVSGSTRNAAVLRRAVDEATRLRAVLVPVIAWTPVGGGRVHPCPSLAALWQQAARTRLDDAFADTLGGYPTGLRIDPVVIRDEAGPALVRIADQPGDMLVVGAGRRGPLQRLVHGAVSRYCVARALCTVIAVPDCPVDSVGASPAHEGDDSSRLIAA